MANGGVAIATVLAVPGDEAAVERVRALQSFSGEVGVSAWNGLAVARLCAKDGAAPARAIWSPCSPRSAATLPRLWLN